jgi:hypothetical protein
MSRLRRVAEWLQKVAKPRTKKKELVVTVKFTFEVLNDNEDEAKADLRKFKEWMNQQFTQWNSSILQYFLYSYKLQQNADDERYRLEHHIDKIIKDDSATIDERTRMNRKYQEDDMMLTQKMNNDTPIGEITKMDVDQAFENSRK